MARRRKTESKAPMKQEPKPSVRKSTRQKAKKKQLENGGDITSENTNSFLVTNGKQEEEEESTKMDDVNKSEMHKEECESHNESSVNIENNLDKQNYENDATKREASIDQLKSPCDKPAIVEEKITNEAVCWENTVEEITIYEEMEIETESRVECSVIPNKTNMSQVLFNYDSELKEKKILECSETGNEITNDSRSLSKNCECANSNSYQMVEEGLSGLRVSEICESSSSPVPLTTVQVDCNKTSLVPFDNFYGKFEISSQNGSKDGTYLINDISSEKENDRLLKTLADNKLIEEHSRDYEINSKLDLEDTKLSSSSESSSDTLFPKTCGMLYTKQYEMNYDKTGKKKSEDSSSDPTARSENESNTSGVRRSNRIKHIGLQKQRSRGRGLVMKPIQEPQKILVCPAEGDHLTSRAAAAAQIPEEEHGNEILKTKNNPVQDHLSNVINCDSNANKPVKVKSRWRRSSELEMSSIIGQSSNVSFAGNDVPVESGGPGTINMNIGGSCCNQDSYQMISNQESYETRLSLEDSVNMITSYDVSQNASTAAIIPNNVGAKMHLPMVPAVDREMEERLSQFEHLRENLYLTERYTNKETKRMVCDCFLTEEEIQRGELGCGEDCLNRLLMIECGSRCIVGDRCTNRRFQNCNYAKCQVFRTEKKGFGLRAIIDLNAGEFIMEYVGEVVDSRDFRRRAKEYSKDKNRHYYFMALKSDQIIDATMKGNISRFINHSCDPNAETQKWTVNGELRIGFFNKKFVAAGEEITFDYHFQRYGKEAQKCFCEAANCRGWIGDNPEDGKAHVECPEDEDECMEDDEEDDDDEDESEEDEEEEDHGDKMDQVQERKKKEDKKEKAEKHKKMVDHMEDEDLEEQIDRLCAGGLKNRAHTLTLSRLMVRCRELQHRRRLLEVIRSGEQPCRRLFLDYHGLRLMWSYMMDVAGSDSEEARQFRLEIVKTLKELPIPNRTMLIDSKVLSVIDKWSKQLDHSPSGESPDDEQQQFKLTASEEVGEMKEASSDKDSSSSLKAKKEDEAAAAPLEESLSELADNLLESWSNLKEVFRIPKKERLEQMKEHEREADRGYKEDAAEREARETPTYERHRSAAAAAAAATERYRGGVVAGGGGGESDKRSERRRGPPATAAAADSLEERPNLVQVPRMSKFERRQLFALKVAKEEEQRQRRQQEELWQQHQAQCLALGVDPYATAALDPQSGYPLFFDPQLLAQWQAFPGPPGTEHYQQQQQQSAFCQQPASAHRAGLESLADAEQPPPALDLPPKWKWARDKRGRVYYYHVRERVPQWLPPPPDHIGLQPDSGPDSSSGADDDSSDDDESNSDKDEDDEDDVSALGAPEASDATEAKADERDELPNEGADEAVEHLLLVEQEQQQQQQQQQQQLDTRKRRAGLVQERIISPRREEDRVDHSKFKELKDKLRRQKAEKSRLKEHLQSEKERKHRRTLKSKSHAKQSSQFKTITSDMSPTSERKIKDVFRINMAHVMVHFLNPYRKNDCKQGRITNTEDFKYLARKLTHFVLAKELKHCKSVDELECNDNVKHKAKDFVRKYMNKFGAVYQRDKDED